MRETELSKGLNNLFNDRIRDVTKKTILVYSRTEVETEIQNKLDEWAKLGFIEILKPIVEANSFEPCIRLITRITLPSSEC
jgi:hypothetical protein